MQSLRQDSAVDRPRTGRWRRHLLRGIAVVVVLLVLSSVPWLWTTFGAHGHTYGEADAPAADVVIVLGTAVTADGRQPGERLAGRLETAAELVRTGRARVVLVSGDGGGASGDEPTVMTAYLTETLGVDPRRVVADPFGLDTYDSCIRAKDVYGVQRALIVTQSYHLSRAVTLCRHLGLDVDGVTARCDGCGPGLLARKAVRDYFASGKAAWDAVRGRPPAVRSSENPAVRDALSS
ncbi:vancomycin high temperature exclusion protein [Micromonospora sp. MH99]|uniref:SanA/YdcF family protein n=1 Tax=Micromonospora sp. MH99 TaxID=1945510 RepID=UPI001F429DB4|nr:ElyC/SanA/YdcF family protein [Micromonospora sp. MH99]